MSELKIPWGKTANFEDWLCLQLGVSRGKLATQLSVGTVRALCKSFQLAVRFGAEQAEAKHSRLTDPTPLSELSDEQWAGLGFENRGDIYTRYWEEPKVCIRITWDRYWEMLQVAGANSPAKTLGQLNCLMMGLGSHER